jgi:hypothetical protein
VARFLGFFFEGTMAGGSDFLLFAPRVSNKSDSGRVPLCFFYLFLGRILPCFTAIFSVMPEFSGWFPSPHSRCSFNIFAALSL